MPKSKIVNSKIPPHHTLHGFIRPLGVFGIALAVVIVLHVAVNDKINQLADRHARIDAHRLHHRNFECPSVAKPNIAFARRGMDVNAQSPDAAFTLQKGHCSMGFSVFFRHAEIKGTGLQHKTFFPNFEQVNIVVATGVELPIFVNGQIFAEVYVIGIGSEAFGTKGFYDDLSIVNRLQNFFIGQDHSIGRCRVKKYK